MGLFRSVRGRVGMFFLIAGLPVLIIAIVGAYDGYQAAQRQETDRLRLAAEAVAGSIGDVMAGAEQTLVTLSQALDEGMSADACDALLSRTLRASSHEYTILVLLDGSGQVKCSSLGQSIRGRVYANAPAFREIIAGKSMVVGQFQQGRITGLPVIPVGVPMPRADGTVDALVLAIGTGMLEQHGRRNPLREGAQAWLIDERGTPLGVSEGAEPGRLPDAPTLARLMTLDRVEAEGPAVDGVVTRYTVIALRDELRLLVAAPSGNWLNGAHAALIRRFAEAGLLLIVSLAAVLVGLHFSVVRPLRSVSQRIRAWKEGAGKFDAGDLSGAPEEVRDVALAYADATAALLEREQRLSQAVRQRDLIFAEIHHRVKNNLQIVASLLNLQAARTADPAVREEFHVAGERVRTLSTLHRHLYLHADPERIALVPFLTELCNHLFDSFGERSHRGGDRIALVVEAPELALPSDIVVPMALIVTEAVTNALKFAFPSGAGGTVRVTVAVNDDEVSLTIADDGIGRDDVARAGVAVAMDEGEGPGQGSGKGPGDDEAGLGTRLIEAFSAQLGGTLSIGPNDEGAATAGSGNAWSGAKGTRLAITFPLPNVPPPDGAGMAERRAA